MTKKKSRWGARMASSVIGAMAAMTVGCATTAAQDDSESTAREQRNAELVRDAFELGVGGENSFYSILADDVHWTVARAAEPSTYTSRAEFLRDGAGPIVSRLEGEIQADVHALHTDGDTVVALWRGTATARDGRPYVNEYAWVMTMREERIARVTAYLDLVALDDLLTRVPAQPAAEHPYVGMWVTADGRIRQELLPDGRYDEARGDRHSAYTGRYEVRGNRIEYWDDTGFTASGTFVTSDELHHGGMIFYRQQS
ncbi:Atu4866 domain-containing protein [Mycolicibacterium iranicum]|uniref:Atu4866 domain-containing protein n=1 Tax=Mycolicibacterium iranicum TaxID=912594 RepID=A0ABT4H8K1_MYCIR|nr:Atu4866 domain-containing protein [Mycolicibacterium iranicum]MCZ0726516.1 Atu4866 domain-containing protein [Mycolicibacterium iranicum]